MLLQTWSDAFTQSLQGLWIGVVGFTPKLVVAIVIFILGWVIGAILGRFVSQIIAAVKLDKALHSAGFGEVLTKAGFRLDSGAFLGAIVKWFVIIVFLVASLDVLGLNRVNTFFQEVVLLYIPNVIVAALMLLVAAVVSDVVKRVVTGSAKAAGIKSAAFLGGVSKWAIWVLAIIVALSQVGIAPQFMQILFTGLVVMLALAGGLAFGLGGKEAAARFIEKMRGDISNHQ